MYFNVPTIYIKNCLNLASSLINPRPFRITNWNWNPEDVGWLVLSNNYSISSTLANGTLITDGKHNNKHGQNLTTDTDAKDGEFYFETLKWDPEIWTVNGNFPILKWEVKEDKVTVIETIPVDGNANAAVDAQIAVVFSDLVTAGDLSGITIKNNSGNSVTGVSGSLDGNVLTIIHDVFASNAEYTVTVPANAIVGLNEALTFSFTTQLGTANESISASTLIYPSITQGDITITTSELATVKILNLDGQLLNSYQSGGKITVPMNYVNALYIVLIETKDSLVAYKVILRK